MPSSDPIGEEWPMATDAALYRILAEDEEILSLMEQARAYPKTVFSPMWDVYLRFGAAPIRELVALSVGLEPIYAHCKWVYFVARFADHLPWIRGVKLIWVNGARVPNNQVMVRKHLQEFIARLLEATENVEPLGTLKVVKAAECQSEAMVKLHDFVGWAVGRGWKMPDQLRGLVASTSLSESNRPRNTQGTIVKMIDWRIGLILELIRSEGFDPNSIPGVKQGSSDSLKARLRQRVHDDSFASAFGPRNPEKAFDNAWTEARRRGEIKDAKPHLKMH